MDNQQMDNQQYFLVVQNVDSSGESDARTIYPEVHYVFEDDAFAPEMDTVERRSGDISILVDLDESGNEIVGCQSISPDWQVTGASLAHQALDTAPSSHAPQHNSKLLQIQGIRARQDQDIVSLGGSFESQVNTGLSLLEQLERRQHNLHKAILSFAEKERN